MARRPAHQGDRGRPSRAREAGLKAADTAANGAGSAMSDDLLLVLLSGAVPQLDRAGRRRDVHPEQQVNRALLRSRRADRRMTS